MDLLLIFPPFFHPRTPHLALPSLAGYLSSRGVGVSAWDANLGFFRDFLTRDRIDEGHRFVEDRVLDLNGRDHLTPEEGAQYLTFSTLLQSAHGLPLDQASIFGPGSDEDPMEKEDFFRFGAALAGAPYRPEALVLEGALPSVQYRHPFHHLSSRDLVAYARSETMLTPYYRRMLPQMLAEHQPRVVGISVAVEDQMLPAFGLAATVKEMAPDIFVVLGGSFISSAMRRVDQPRIFEIIDGLVLDDGEQPLEALARQCRSPHRDFSRVPGLTYYDGRLIHRNEPAPPLHLEDLPLPDFKILPFTEYLAPARYTMLPFRSSRGCYWAKCAYCRTDAPVVRHYQQASAEFIFDRLSRISDDTGVTTFAFTDEASAPAVMDRLSDRIIQSGRPFQWSTCFRLDRSMSAERCRKYGRAGCMNISYGLEVYNDRLLKVINKGTTVENINFALANTAAAGIFSWTYMMVGLPNETESEARQGFRAVLWLQERGLLGGFNYNLFELYRDSQFWRERDRYGFHDIHIPTGQDLDGPLDEFEVPGMARSTARRLASVFNRGPHGDIRFRQDIPIKDRLITAAHDLREIYRQAY